jgi:hypothetical protein
VNVRRAGVGSVLCALSVARTAKVCVPNVRGLDGVWLCPGPEQAWNAWESNRHWKVEFAWLDVKPNVGLRLVVELDGPEVMVVSGGVESSM